MSSVPAGTVNSNYFLESERGRVFVRLYEQQDVDGVEYEWALLDHLVARGVPVPPRIRGPKPGELRVGGRPVAVFELVKGQDLCQARVTPARLHDVGAALARASKAGEDFPIRRQGRFTLDELVKLHDKAEAAQRPELSAPLARLRALHAELSNAPALPQGVVHGDLFRDNVLWQGDQLAALLDWESASDGIVIYDLAVTLLAWCCGDQLDWTLARALVQGYQSERAIREEEWAGLHWALRVGCLRFASTRLIDVYLKGTYAPGYKSYARFLQRLDAIELQTPESLRALLG
ncbi:MAG TPA: homoserine kinase [Polyangiales bacterium]|nr:homoserine kinase [Polyangiales bacterium]